LIRELLERYDWVLWVDADVVAVDLDADIMAETRRDKDLYAVEHEWLGEVTLNSGVMLLRAGRWARELIDAMWAMEEVTDHQFWENEALVRLLGYELEPYRLINPTPLWERVEPIDHRWNSIELDPASRPAFVHRGFYDAATRQRQIEADLGCVLDGMSPLTAGGERAARGYAAQPTSPAVLSFRYCLTRSVVASASRLGRGPRRSSHGSFERPTSSGCGPSIPGRAMRPDGVRSKRSLRPTPGAPDPGGHVAPKLSNASGITRSTSSTSTGSMTTRLVRRWRPGGFVYESADCSSEAAAARLALTRSAGRMVWLLTYSATAPPRQPGSRSVESEGQAGMRQRCRARACRIPRASAMDQTQKTIAM